MSSEGKCVVAVCQMSSTNDKAENLATVEELVRKSKSLDAKMVFLPEACDFISESRKETLDLSEELTGSLMTSYKNLAARYDVWLSLGGLHESCASDEKVYNTHVVIDNTGSIAGLYRKLHLFDVFIPEKGVDLRESKVVSAGDAIVRPVGTPAGALGLSICYDVRFPELGTCLRRLGATILTYPSAFTFATGKAHWEVLLRARAVENQCYVVAAAQVGQHNPKRLSYGRAMIINPWGKILTECPVHSDAYKETGTVATAAIEPQLLQSIREQMPTFSHRRGDVYDLSVVSTMIKNGSGGDRSFADKVIAAGTVFYETQYSFAFTNIRCVLPGHVLVASNRVAKRLQDLTREEVADLFQTAVAVQKMLEQFYGATSSTIVVQDGKDAGQTVPHVHCHVLPRTPADFSQNDDIYEALATHDRTDSPMRDPHEMEEEAKRYKNLLLN